MQQIKIITIGKLKNKSLKQEIEELSKRIQRLEIIELKEIKGKTIDEIKQKEEEIIIQYVKETHATYLLHEHGKTFTTKSFSSMLLSQTGPITFVITGAFGPSEYLISKFSTLSLSSMTFTHEQALYLLVEQLYRVQCIEKNIPYTK